MSKQIQIRGGAAAWNNGFTGASREITVDTTGNTIRIHNGSTPGGAGIHYPASAFVGGTLMPAVDAPAVRTVLGLGSAALVDSGSSVGNAVALITGPKLPALDGSLLLGVLAAGSVVNIQVLTAGTTYTRSVGAIKGDIFLVGGGGGGGGAPATGASQFSAGGGGGSGGFTVALNVALPATATVAIGAGGTGGVATNVTVAGTGGTTSFTGGALTLTAGGGAGGQAVGPAGVIFGARPGGGGAPGTFTGGTSSVFGNEGAYGTGGYAGGLQAVKGAGGSSLLFGFGAGGAGVGILVSSSGLAGNAGLAGCIIVVERS